VNSQGTALAKAFFGFSVLLYGYLIFRSTFLPRWLGVLGMISGLCWLTFIYPPFGRGIFVYTAIFGLLSSVAMIVRLLIGVNEERWKETAAAAICKSRKFGLRDHSTIQRRPVSFFWPSRMWLASSVAR
jgi:hypothetical protein